jgi:hypothetical protein
MADALVSLHDVWSHVKPADVLPLGPCPNAECRTLRDPASGYVDELAQQCAARHDIVVQLLDWTVATGGEEAPVWQQA